MITALTDIQAFLPKEYRNDTILRKKLLNAVRTVDFCRLAYQKPAETVQSVISNLHFSLAFASNVISPTTESSGNVGEPSAHYVDRRYMGSLSSRPPTFKSNPPNKKRCIVCKNKTLKSASEHRNLSFPMCYNYLKS